MSENLTEKDLCATERGVGSPPTSPKVSVIVPVYKVEKYLPECIDSILAQTFTDFELILVDDGSPDNSGKICDDYAARDSRIRVFHKENGGVSSARNLGIARARAQYVSFLDADDWWDEAFLEKMYTLSRKFPDAPMCCCGWICVEREEKQQPTLLRGFDFGESLLFDLLEYASRDGYLPVVTNSVFLKKEILDELGGFDTGLVMYEDFDMWFRAALKGKTAYYNEALSFTRRDTPVENKPRGRLPDINRHWVVRIEKYLDSKDLNPHYKVFLSKFCLRVLLAYRGDEKSKEVVRKILSKVDRSAWTWKYKVVYRTPIRVGNVLLYLNRVCREQIASKVTFSSIARSCAYPKGMFRGILRRVKRCSLKISVVKNLFLFSVNGIRYGRDCRVYGKTGLQVFGNVRIGNRFVLNSGVMTNPMGANLNSFIRVDKGADLVIGNNVGLSSSTIWCAKNIILEDEILVGAGTIITDTDAHSLNPEYRGTPQDSLYALKKGVHLKKGCFVGARCFIGKGVVIGKNSIVGAGSVVTKSIPDNEIWAGNPAKFIKPLKECLK